MIRYTFLLLIALTVVIGVVAQQPAAKTAVEIRNEAIRLLGDGKIEEAIAKLEESVTADAEDPTAFMLLGSAYSRLKMFEKSEAALRKVIELTPENEMAHAGLCVSLGYQKEFAEAQQACDEAYRLAPDSEFINAVRLETMFLSGKNTSDVIRQLDIATAKYYQNTAILRVAVNIHMATRNFEYAATLLERLITFEPDVAEHHGRLAQAYLKLGRDVRSLAEARRAIELDNTDPFGNFAMGLIFYELGQYEEAAESFSRIPPETRWLGEARRLYALCLGNMGRPSEAADILAEVAEAGRPDVQLLYELGNQLLEAKRNTEAIEVLKRVDRSAPNNLPVLAGLGMANMNLANFDEAIRYFDLALALSPGNPLITEVARVSRVRRNSENELAKFLGMVEQNPKNGDLMLKIGRILGNLNRIDEAEPYFEKVWEFGLSDSKSYVWVGISYSEAGRLEKALEAHKRSLGKNDGPDGYVNLASVLSRLGRFDEATEAYEKFLEYRPNDAPILMGFYAEHLERAGKRRESLDMYRRVLAIEPTNDIALYRAGILSLKLGEREAAKTYLETLRSVNQTLAIKLEACIRLEIW